jgi:hypothetical protein
MVSHVAGNVSLPVPVPIPDAKPVARPQVEITQDENVFTNVHEHVLRPRNLQTVPCFSMLCKTSQCGNLVALVFQPLPFYSFWTHIGHALRS